jgi:hypothetical protein
MIILIMTSSPTGSPRGPRCRARLTRPYAPRPASLVMTLKETKNRIDDVRQRERNGRVDDGKYGMRTY